MGRVDGKVAFITGAGRGQGRSHAVRLAKEGASIIAVDICAPIPTSAIPLASEHDLAQTVIEVEAVGGRIVPIQADVRDLEKLENAVAVGVADLGAIDIVVANAAVINFASFTDMSAQEFQDIIDVDLVGVWKTCKATLPGMIHRDKGGSVILISSTLGLRGSAYVSNYVAAKHGVLGLMKALAIELGSHGIRVNAICPSNVNTDMFNNDVVRRRFVPDEVGPSFESFEIKAKERHLIPIPYVDPLDISNMVLFLASDESRYITGAVVSVDAGSNQRP